MKYFMNRKKRKSAIAIFFGMFALSIALAALILKIINFLRMFKKNTDDFIIFNNTDVDYGGEVFEDKCVAVISAKTTIDLTDSIASNNPMNLCLKCKYSKTEVIVPKDWNVKVQGNALKSNIINEVKFDKENFEAPLLFINYVSDSSHIIIRSLNFEKRIEFDEAEVVEA